MLAAGFAPQAWADTNCTPFTTNPGSQLYYDCSGSNGHSNNRDDKEVIIDTYHGYLENFYHSHVYGGYTETALQSQNNTLSIKSGGGVTRAYGGYTSIGTNGHATFNTLNIDGGTVTNRAVGGYSSDRATKNKVFVSSGSPVHVYGGQAELGEASENEVTVNSGAGWVWGGESEKGEATKNKVFIYGGTVDTVYGGSSDSGSATGNEVTIDGGVVTNDVWAASSTSGVVRNNKIILKSDVPDADVAGGPCPILSITDRCSGNTLEVHGNRQAKSVSRFHNIHFFLPADFGASSGTALTLADGQKVSLNYVEITLKGTPLTLAPGEIPKLISKVDGTPVKVEGLPSGLKWEVDSNNALIIRGAPYPLTLVASPTEGGEVTCSSDVWRGGSTTCTATPKPGYTYNPDSIGLASGAATVNCSGNTCELTNVTSALSVKASFTKGGSSTHNITTAVSPAGSGRITCTPTTVADGATVNITCTAAPESGYKLGGLSLNGTSCGSTTTCTATAVASDLEVKAEFTPITVPTHAITGTSSGNGTISCSPTEAEEGKGVTITCTPSPDAGYALGSLSLPGGTCSGTTCSIANVTGPLNVSAVFTPFTGTHAITTEVIPAEGGSVDCDATSVASGGSVTCTATANEGYTYDDDSIRLASGSASVNCGGNTCTLTDVASALSVKATFTKNGGGNTGGNGDGSTQTPCPACDNSSPTMGELGLLLSGIALAGAAAPALRRRERKARKQD